MVHHCDTLQLPDQDLFFFLKFLFYVFFWGRRLQGQRVDNEGQAIKQIGVHDMKFTKINKS